MLCVPLGTPARRSPLHQHLPSFPETNLGKFHMLIPATLRRIPSAQLMSEQI